ncbi:hypothetical protein [Microbacterium sp. JZ31]|nr:hypothetical protein [Microbacterium sp. JZ31]
MAETHNTDDPDQLIEATAGMRMAFWSWAVLVVAGVAVMITLPLMGR